MLSAVLLPSQIWFVSHLFNNTFYDDSCSFKKPLLRFPFYFHIKDSLLSSRETETTFVQIFNFHFSALEKHIICKPLKEWIKEISNICDDNTLWCLMTHFCLQESQPCWPWPFWALKQGRTYQRYKHIVTYLRGEIILKDICI